MVVLFIRSPQGTIARALYDFNAERHNELTISAGDELVMEGGEGGRAGEWRVIDIEQYKH